MRKVIMSSVLALSLVALPAFAGNSNQSGQSSQAGQSEQSEQAGQAGQAGQSEQAGQTDQGCNKKCFFGKIKQSVQKGFAAGKKAGTKAHDAIQNKIMDAGTAVKKEVCGTKDKTFVKGHYTKNGTHVKGYWKNVDSKK